MTGGGFHKKINFSFKLPQYQIFFVGDPEVFLKVSGVEKFYIRRVSRILDSFFCPQCRKNSQTATFGVCEYFPYLL